jgi:hypothetical protein
MSRVQKILKHASIINKRLERQLRRTAITTLHSFAQQENGILQYFNDNVTDYPTREQNTVGRGGEDDSEKLYGVGIPKHEKTDLSEKVYNRSLSTRYSPDRVGVQAARIGDGVCQDPITNKIYDWNDGFKTEDGENFVGGGVALQTDIFSR